LTVHKKSRFHANREILAVFYSEKYGDFVELIKFFGVIGTLNWGKCQRHSEFVGHVPVVYIISPQTRETISFLTTNTNNFAKYKCIAFSFPHITSIKNIFSISPYRNKHISASSTGHFALFNRAQWLPLAQGFRIIQKNVVLFKSHAKSNILQQ